MWITSPNLILIHVLRNISARHQELSHCRYEAILYPLHNCSRSISSCRGSGMEVCRSQRSACTTGYPTLETLALCWEMIKKGKKKWPRRLTQQTWFYHFIYFDACWTCTMIIRYSYFYCLCMCVWSLKSIQSKSSLKIHYTNVTSTWC